MRSPISRTASIALALLLVGCGARPSPTPAAGRIVSLVFPVPTTDKAQVDAAIDVFGKRLKALGIGNFTISTGDTMTFKLTVPDSVENRDIDAVLRTPGVFAFVPWPANKTLHVGESVPDGLAPLFDWAAEVSNARVRKDSMGQPALEITFRAAGADALNSYTTAHISEPLPLVLDGKVLTAPFIQSPISNDILITAPTITSPDDTSLSLQAMAAIVASGPLPPAWRALP